MSKLALRAFYARDFAPTFLVGAAPRTFEAYEHTLNTWERFTADAEEGSDVLSRPDLVYVLRERIRGLEQDKQDLRDEMKIKNQQMADRVEREKETNALIRDLHTLMSRISTPQLKQRSTERTTIPRDVSFRVSFGAIENRLTSSGSIEWASRGPERFTNFWQPYCYDSYVDGSRCCLASAKNSSQSRATEMAPFTSARSCCSFNSALSLATAVRLFERPLASTLRVPPTSVHQALFCLFHQTVAERDMGNLQV
jgi:hypothetical protein